jgi:arylsulfatase A-like enzyme/Flp pilus assembly protein TadD
MPGPRVFRYFLCLCLAVSAFAAPPPPNIILITLDTTRADRVGFLGSKRGLTPNLDLLARHAMVFSHAYAHVPLTTASHATIFTGTYPQFNHVNDFGVPLSPRLPYLPDLLHQHGYHTAAFVGSLVLDPFNGTAPGFERGFDTYDAGFRLKPPAGDRYKTLERRAGEVVDRALAWLAKYPQRPFFLWLHLYDAHDPYDPPSPYKERYQSDPYDGEIAYADSAAGKLLSALRTRGLYQGSIIAVMADHGEAFGEHGERTHGVFLYDETIHVPLLFKLPGEVPGGQNFDFRVGLVDIAPTLLQAAGIAIPAEMQGKSLLGAMQPGLTHSRSTKPSAEDPPAYAETDYPRRAFGWSPLQALRSGKYLYIQAPNRELYNQSSDPEALHNLAPVDQAVTETMGSQLEQFRRKTTQSLAELAKPDPEQLEKLRALGYIASDVSQPESSDTPTGIDPKDKIEVANLLHYAMLEIEDGFYDEAIPKLERVLSQQPQMALAEMQLGVAWARLKNYERAIPPLQSAIQRLPDSATGHYELGLALFETGQWKDAAPQFGMAVARAPHWADAHFSLASVYARIDRVPEAMQELDTALKLNPDHYRANLLRGRILSLKGDAAAALPNLKKATAVQPDSREAHLFLAEAYTQLGQDENAQRERAQAEHLSTAAKH